MMKEIPVVNYLCLDQGHRRLIGQECLRCGAVFLGRRNACARCSGQEFSGKTFGETGRIRSFTIVHRAPAGIDTPYIAVIVDHDGGGTAKANLIGVDPVPEQIEIGAPVGMLTFPVGTDNAGSTAIGFGYELL